VTSPEAPVSRGEAAQAISNALVAAVEANTGREVLAFLSDHHIDPDVAVEIFILKPRSGPGDRDGAAPSADGDGSAAGPAI